MSTDWFGFLLVAIAGIVSYMAFRSAFPLFKFAASVMWIAVYMWLKDYSPTGTEGQPFQVVAMLGAVVMVVAFMLTQLGTEINRQKDYRSGLNTETTGNFSFKIPDWLKSTTTSGAEKVSRERRERETEEYRDRLHRVLHPPRKRR